jgi:hypothetical protein
VSADVVTALATCLVALATIVGVGIAALGLRTWRLQLQGTAHFDLARRLLLEVYRLRDALERVRSPLMMVSEAAGADDDLPWELTAYERRWQRVVEAQAPLEVCVYESEILWGDAARTLMRELAGQTNALYLALGAFARSKHDEHESLTQEQRGVLYGGSEHDAFSAELRTTVEGFEAYVRPHLPAKT